jgi:hypothetical protein
MDIWLLIVIVWFVFWLIVWLVVWSIFCLLGLVLYKYMVPWLRRRGSLIRQWSRTIGEGQAVRGRSGQRSPQPQSNSRPRYSCSRALCRR